jgi:hypothetical protein
MAYIVSDDRIIANIDMTYFKMHFFPWEGDKENYYFSSNCVCFKLFHVGQVQGFRLSQHWFEYFIQ